MKKDLPTQPKVYPEGAHCKVGNGWKRRIDMPELNDRQWYEFLAENGHASYQLELSAIILARDTHSNRIVDSFKWAFLSNLIGKWRCEAAVNFLIRVMSEEERDLGFSLAEAWLDEKSTENLDEDRTGWSSDLKAFLRQK